ncbi:hypothetical protein KFL_003620130 [Klebsormidium nitens]|uniref:RING-type domain-containing protein n=1 Tax=Klebsormidium nitens TaxID=105231 RepID=A0A1Y1IC88_KLENI|nr:hypothetical protein KFL_003620130 [Klebsormidium nitens]|eukprot:GAQ87582.1 hypothetical protein KFL_003620130 [Klebsormidium nitens]
MPAGPGGQLSTGGGTSISRGLGRKGPVVGAALVGTPGSRKAGEKVHFCVLCDLPIAIYGLLVPCQHVFCLACANALGKTCPRCSAAIQSVDAVRSPPGVLICGIPTCLRAFLSKPELLLHVHESHQDLFKPATPPPSAPSPLPTQHRPLHPRSEVDFPPFFRGPAPGGFGPGRPPGPGGPLMAPEGFRPMR